MAPALYEKAMEPGYRRERTTVRIFSTAMRVVHDYCKPRNYKPEIQLHLATGHHIRACEYWIAGQRAGNGAAVVRLMFTDMGPALIKAWRADMEALGVTIPEWIDDLEMMLAAAQAMRAQKRNEAQASNLRRKICNLPRTGQAPRAGEG